MKIVYPNKNHFESIVPIIFKNLLKALVPISFEICPPVLTNTKTLWKLSIQMKITSNKLFPSSLRIRWKLESQSSLKSVRRDWQKWKTCENCLFHQHGPSIQLGKWKIDKNCCYIINVFGEKQLLLNPKRCGLFGGVLFREIKFVLSNFLSNEDLSISYESWDVQLTFDTLINAFRFKV